MKPESLSDISSDSGLQQFKQQLEESVSSLHLPIPIGNSCDWWTK